MNKYTVWVGQPAVLLGKLMQSFFAFLITAFLLLFVGENRGIYGEYCFF